MLSSLSLYFDSVLQRYQQGCCCSNANENGRGDIVVLSDWDTVEHGGFVYDSDSYADDLPYWTRVDGTNHLVVPYTLDTNDMRFAIAGGFPSGDEFFTHLRDAFDVLYAEGVAGAPKMLSIGLHCRLVGRPARIASLERFLDHVQSHEGVWITRRIDIARHWAEHFPAP